MADLVLSVVSFLTSDEISLKMEAGIVVGYASLYMISIRLTVPQVSEVIM